MKSYINYINKKIKDYFHEDEKNLNNTRLIALIFLIIFSGCLLFILGYLNYGEKNDSFVICLILTIIMLPAINFFQLSTSYFLKDDKRILIYYSIVLFGFVAMTIGCLGTDVRVWTIYWIWCSLIAFNFILLYWLRLGEKKNKIYVNIAVWPMFLIWFIAFHFDEEKSAIKDIIRYITIISITVLIQSVYCYFFIYIFKGELAWKLCVITTAVIGFILYYIMYKVYEKKGSFYISGWKALKFHVLCMNGIYLCLKIAFINSFENAKGTKIILNISANEYLFPTVTAVVLFFEIFLKPKLDNKDIKVVKGERAIHVAYCKENVLYSKADESVIEGVIDKVLVENTKAVEDFKGGKEKAKQALFGACMRELKGTANTDVIRELLDEKLENI